MPELASQGGGAVEPDGPMRRMKIISQILVIAIINLTCTYSYAWVDPTTTTVAVHKKAVTQVFRQQLLDLTDRQEIVDRLVQYGVTKEDAIRRINSLTDEEIETYLAKIDELPSVGRSPEDWKMLLALVVALPIFALAGPVSIIIKTPVSIICLNHLKDYSNCFVNNAGMFGSTYPVVKEDLKPVSCLAPCYYDFNDCMESSGDVGEENQCIDMKSLCVQKC